MSYTKSKEYKGWIYDDADDMYISPKGRLADYPGAPFFGTLSKESLAEVKKEAEGIPEITTEEIPMSVPILEVVKTVTVGDVTVNWLRVR